MSLAFKITKASCFLYRLSAPQSVNVKDLIWEANETPPPPPPHPPPQSLFTGNGKTHHETLCLIWSSLQGLFCFVLFPWLLAMSSWNTDNMKNRCVQIANRQKLWETFHPHDCVVHSNFSKVCVGALLEYLIWEGLLYFHPQSTVF